MGFRGLALHIWELEWGHIGWGKDFQILQSISEALLNSVIFILLTAAAADGYFGDLKDVLGEHRADYGYLGN